MGEILQPGQKMNSGPTVFIVDDDPDLREWLRAVLELEGLRAEPFCSAEEFLQAFAPPCLGCVVADARAPQMGGMELQARLARMGQPVPLILLTNYADVAMAVQAMKAGVASVVEKPINRRLLLDAVGEVIAREAEHHAQVDQIVEIQSRIGSLTTRERQVLEMVTAGMASKDIAVNLSVSRKTIDSHRAHIMKKMNAHSVAELVRLAIVSGTTRLLR